MAFWEAVATGFRKYAVFDERGSRSEFFWWLFFNMLVTIATLALDLTLYPDAPTVISGAAGLSLFVPNLAATVRRLHDWDASVWLVLLGLIPVLGWVAVLALCLMPGSKNTNRYGRKPHR